MSRIELSRSLPTADESLAYFAQRLRFETDSWDVNEAMASGAPGFVLLDVRDRIRHGNGHIAGAINIPYRELTAHRMSAFPERTLFVVYCAGPHCNSAHKAAVRLASLGRPVKEMIGGTLGWVEDGFELVRG